MKLFEQIVKTAVNVACIPIDLAKDVFTLGGAIIDEEPAIKQRLEKIKEDAEG